MKKKLSILLVVAMILSMLPTSAFASSSNKPTSQPIVAKEKSISGVSLVVDLDDQNTKTGEVIFTLENGKWEDTPVIGASLDDIADLGGVNVVYNRISDTQLMIKIPVDTKVAVPMPAKSGKEVGDVKVTLDPRDTDFSAGTYTIAVVAGGSTVSSITKENITVGESVSLKPLIIDETVIKGVTIKKVKLVAPAGFTWTQGNVVTLTGIAGYAEGANVADQTATVAWDGTDKETAIITIPNDYVSETKRGMLSISGLVLTADTDVEAGDVKVEVVVYKNLTEVATTQSDVIFATCVDYGYTLKADTAKALIAGRFNSSISDAEHATAKLTIEEKTANSWWVNRATTFTVPEGVKILGFKVDTFDNIGVSTSGLTKTSYDFTNGSVIPAGIKISNDEDMVTLSGLTSVTDKKAKLVVIFYVSVAADFEGDVVVTVGNSVDETELVVATAKPAIDVTFATTNTGIANQDVVTSDITIVENFKGALKKDANLEIVVEDIKFVKTGTLDVEVTEGNAIVDKAYSQGGKVILKLKRASTTASTIVIKGLEVTLDRTLAEGGYSLEVSGPAFLENGADTVGKFEYVESIDFEDYINVTTAAPDKTGTTTNKVAVTIGSSTYTVNGVAKTLDASPIIQNDRTLVPTRAISEGLGYQVLWNAATNTATVVAPGNRTAAITLGSNVITVNGVAGLTMDTVPVVTAEGRMLVPFRALGEALGIAVTWDATTNTATFN